MNIISRLPTILGVSLIAIICFTFSSVELSADFCKSFKSNQNRFDYSFSDGNHIHFVVINQNVWKLEKTNSTKFSLNPSKSRFPQPSDGKYVMAISKIEDNRTLIGLYHRGEKTIDWFPFKENSFGEPIYSTNVSDNIFGNFETIIGFPIDDFMFGVVAQNQSQKRTTFYHISKEITPIPVIQSLPQFDESLKVMALFGIPPKEKPLYLAIVVQKSQSVLKYCYTNETVSCTESNSIDLIDCTSSETTTTVRKESEESLWLEYSLIAIGITLIILLTILIIYIYFCRNPKKEKLPEKSTEDKKQLENTEEDSEKRRKKEEYSRRLARYYQRQSNRDALKQKKTSPSVHSLGFETNNLPINLNEPILLENNN